ncbi:polysaccharide biosynthesis/export family protein (plasmid) [Salipiger sp. H15]|uniref:Polysaccharide biosynthesis/export family protein n=1 Tax=Alloyangia sp. H15 TaxID=3029062 RepID=A0AAU8APW7_9RHOB
MRRAQGIFPTILILLCALASASASRADMAVERGDTLAITILEAPEMNRTGLVGPDGRIMLAGLGGIEVAGLGLDAVRDAIAGEIKARGLIREPTVLVVFDGWRPYYVGGTVGNPGAYDYAPGLTVRQALTTAGGLTSARPQGGDISLEVARLVAERRAVAYRLLQIEAHIAGLQEELDLGEETPPSSAEGVLSDAEASTVREQERALNEDVTSQRDDARAHLEQSLDLVAVELDVLEKQAQLRVGEQARQQAEVDSARSLLEKGLVPTSRLTETIRDNSRILSDMLDVQSYIARARQEDATIRYQIRAAETEWRIKRRADLSEALAKRIALESEMQSYTSRLLATGMASLGDASAAAPVPEFTIHRSGAGEATSFAATMDSEILPGDVLDVDLAQEPRG